MFSVHGDYVKMEKSKIKKILKETCFGSLSYCCGLESPCSPRDKVIKQLGLTKKEFIKLKNNFDKELFELLNKKNG